jgi:hypothetical protein
VAYADAAVDQLLPPFSVVAAGTLAWTLLAVVRRRAGVALAMTAAHGVYVLSALRLTGAPRSAYRALLGAPRFVAWKVALWLKTLLRRDDVAWVRTARNTVATE